MKKTFEYKDLQIAIDRTNAYGHYWLRSNVNGKPVELLIDDSSIYDWCDDDSDLEKHEQAKREAYGYIMRAYEASM